jgi:hypothetical protein
MSAAGHYVPPLVVVPQKGMKIELMDEMPPASVYACHISGWIQTDIFMRWFRHFTLITKPTTEDPLSLILDGHYSHMRDSDVSTIARDNYVAVLCLAPHSPCKMQPLDMVFMTRLKHYYP